MSDKANSNGRAYEYICLTALAEQIASYRRMTVVEDSTWEHCRDCWDALSARQQETYRVSATVAARKILAIEPRIIEASDDALELLIQSDSHGAAGDARDVLVVRRDIAWEIGLSVKHNHFAVKHSRLSGVLDFGEKWYGVPCSEQYWQSVRPVFAYLDSEKQRHSTFASLPNKVGDVYEPLLSAFRDELLRQYAVHRDIPARIVEYLIGTYDFYKVICVERRKLTQIQSFNLRGTLNKRSSTLVAKETIPRVHLPQRIISIAFAPDRANTLELFMDAGWTFSLRLHNARTYVESSLKFDIQIVGMPTTIITINCLW